MRAAFAIVSSALLAAGCASSAQQAGPFTPESERSLELIVRNETLNVVEAYVEWSGGGRRRLGDIPAGRSLTSRVPVQGQVMRVSFAAVGRRPVGSQSAAVEPGERMEWVLRSDGTVFYRRL
jgi:hypothetical protein